VSLQGTLDTLSLPELCELLSGTNKTGALHVRAESGQGVLWFADGKVCAGEAGSQTGPPPPGVGGDPLQRLHDVCFELFRFSEGTFEFEAERRPSWPADKAVDVSGLVAETERRMAEWRDIIAVIPSVEARPRLVPDPPDGGPITLDATQWRVVTGIDGRRRVSALIRVLDGGEFTVCKVLRSLVQAGLVEIEPADGSTPPALESPAAGAAAALDALDPPAKDARPAPSSSKTGGRSQQPSTVIDAESTPEPVAGAEGSADDPLADGLDRGAVVALLASARTK
jgi:hypothetical protein